MDRARLLLSGTDCPVLEIIGAVGYKNYAYFYDVFKDATGMTPAEYRERMTGEGIA